MKKLRGKKGERKKKRESCEYGMLLSRVFKILNFLANGKIST